MVTILDLPESIIETVLHLVSNELRNVYEVARACKALSSVALCDSLWLRICKDRFPQTDPRLWITRGIPEQWPRSAILRAKNYRAAYEVLHKTQFLVGLWRPEGTAVRMPLYEFHWELDCISGTCLIYDSMHMKPLRSQEVTIAPSSATVAEQVGTRHCVLRTTAARSSIRVASRAAESAAAVAMAGLGGSPTSTVVLGSSPEGSWEHEMLLFMQGNVAGSRQGRRRSSRSPSSSSSGQESQGSRLVHLVRVARPVPTARHPLAGLWKADYGVNGIQIVQVSYDFTGMAAKIIAVKVTGDAHVPAGEDTWHAQAAPLDKPWSPNEAALVDLQEELKHDDVDFDFSRQVTTIYKGTGKLAGPGFTAPHWVEGRLWLYDDGDMGFLWLDTSHDFQLVDLKRIDSDLR